MVLAGPTMSLDGPMRVIRCRKPFSLPTDTYANSTQLEHLLTLPWGERVDHAEGITLFEREGHPPRLLVVYYSPEAGRLSDGFVFMADLFALPD